jgi:hypothetical protein
MADHDRVIQYHLQDGHFSQVFINVDNWDTLNLDIFHVDLNFTAILNPALFTDPLKFLFQVMDILLSQHSPALYYQYGPTLMQTVPR